MKDSQFVKISRPVLVISRSVVGLRFKEKDSVMQKPDFSAFYQTVHGYAPFPWQIRLSERVAQGRWPQALNLPTSSGKTAVVDVWLWAHSIGIAGMPRRLYYVIDRRLLVDAVADYAQDLFARSAMVGHVVRMCGGMGAAEDTWMLNPGGLALISTTLDQVGSRLLCRAYGASRWTAPVHAGLVGNDALIVIDEAHLVEPFRQTLHRIERWRSKATLATHSPWHVLTMTATPMDDSADVLTLSDDDRVHPLLSRRLSAAKLARLVNGKPSDLAGEALRLRLGGADVVGVVVNTVDTARMVYQQLAAQAECLLIIGRARPLERDLLAVEVMARAGTGTRSQGRQPLFVVATQTLEVGLDLDFDAMVSELAPVSALRQRFGRLDRLGELGSSFASVVKVPAAKWPYAKDELDDAWKWLEARTVKFGKLGKAADVGIAAQGETPAEPVLRSPVLGWPDLKLLFDPAVDIDITPYLHGEKRSTEAFVAWRSALDELPPEEWGEAVESAPPTGLELMPIPLHTLKRWLSGLESSASDLESTPEPEEVTTRVALPQVLRWDGEVAELVKISSLRTSDIVVLPASRGGCDRFGWDPASRVAVRDLFEEGLAVVPSWSGNNERTRWAIGLAEHMAGVGAKAAGFAKACGLSQAMIDTLDEAGRLHDLGKNDPRFQLMLGSFDGRLLAKSGSHEVAVSRKLAGLPRCRRHPTRSSGIKRRPGNGRPWQRGCRSSMDSGVCAIWKRSCAWQIGRAASTSKPRPWKCRMPLELTALQGHTPIGFMAAVGLLRIAPIGTKLSWNPSSQTAELHGLERETLLPHLLRHMTGRVESPELHLANDVRGFTQERFRTAYDNAAEPLASWLRAWWREDGKDGNAAPTNLCLTGGPQRMIKMARDLAQDLDPARKKGADKLVLAKFDEALFGPWRYQDDYASWGWDPATFRLAAFTPRAPTTMKMEGVAGAYWLAWESQPLFPCIHGTGTLGFEFHPRAWTWATWSVPLDLHAVQALLKQPQEAQALGGMRYRSSIVVAGQIQYFEPARTIF